MRKNVFHFKKDIIILHAVILCVGKRNVALNITFRDANATLLGIKTSINNSLATL